MSRSATCSAVLLALTLSIPAQGWAKGKPAPVACPLDVAQAVAAACPCNGTPEDPGLLPWRNHGEYVRCVAHYRNALRKAGCLSSAEKRSVVRCAAQAPCGKPGAPIVCCTTTLGVCSDALPDGIPAGTCSNAPTVGCDVATDCAVTTTSFVDDPVGCTAGGGTVEGDGAVCSVCAAR